MTNRKPSAEEVRAPGGAGRSVLLSDRDEEHRGVLFCGIQVVVMLVMIEVMGRCKGQV